MPARRARRQRGVRPRGGGVEPVQPSKTPKATSKFFLYMHEVKEMRGIYGRVSSALEVILHKRATFNEMNHMHQHQTVRRNLEQLTLEVPLFIARLEELCDTIDEKIGWKEFKFCFKCLTSQVVASLIQKEQFTVPCHAGAGPAGEPH
ncbi:hypothetical protein pipiens_019010, partial [Culex pipiens pipiens]